MKTQLRYILHSRGAEIFEQQYTTMEEALIAKESLVKERSINVFNGQYSERKNIDAQASLWIEAREVEVNHD